MMDSSIGKILIVDDEVELKNILVEALISQGYEAVGFNAGEEALEALRKHAFDVLLTDLMMPQMDGISLVGEGVQIDPNLICIMMTGQGTIQTAVDAMKIGTFDYVLKPFRLQTMLPVLTRAMNMRHLRLENVQLREAVAIHELSETIAFTLDPQTVLSKLADGALQQSEADEVSVLLPTSNGDELFVAAVRGKRRERLLGERVPFGQSISSWVARQHEPVLLHGEVDDERFVALWPRPDIRSSVSIPMLVAKKLVGVLNLNAVDRPRPFTLGQMKALTILAGTAAAALESAALYTQVQQAEKSYRSIFENAVEGFFQSTPEGRFITVNPALASILGYESPAAAIENFTDIAHQLYVDPEFRAEANSLLQERGLLVGFEFEAYRKDGQRIWLSENRRIVRDDFNKRTYYEGTLEDITTRKQVEEAVRLSQQQYESLVHSIDGIVWELDAATFRFTFVSQQAERLLGYPPERWINEPNFWPDHLHPEDRLWVLDFCVEATSKQEDHQFDYRMIAADGRVVWLRDSVTVDARDPERILLRGVMVDITERKQAEVELKQSEERYRDLVENARDIIYEHDLEGHYTATNNAGLQLTGYSLAETLELNLMERVAPEYLEKAREMLRLRLAGEIVTAYELEILTKEGDRVPVEVNTRLVYQNGVPVGVQGIARDLTERKHLEEALRESEQQQRQSQKLEAIGQLAGGVAHDFNNLLTAINGYSALALRRVGDDHPVTSYLEEIKKAGDRAANLTRQLLAFGRKQLLQPLALNLNNVVGDMIKLLKRLIGEDIELVTKPCVDLKQIKADPGQLEQVLVNLVVNARDAMPRGGTLTIETANTTLDAAYASRHVGVTPGEYVLLAISDTGTGMDHDTQSRIFEPFFTTKEKDKGTGLGLSTVYGIVKQSGGNIWVYSELGKGTTFKVYLPLVEEEVTALAETAGRAPIKRGSETVLLVEDESMVRKLASELLAESGYIVLEANGGEAAINLGKEHKAPIDLLITDVVMPKFSGKEVAEQLRAIHPETKVLFMSGYTDEAIVHHGIVDSDIAFIQKPFSERALAQKIRDVLDSTNGHG